MMDMILLLMLAVGVAMMCIGAVFLWIGISKMIATRRAGRSTKDTSDFLTDIRVLVECAERIEAATIRTAPSKDKVS